MTDRERVEILRSVLSGMCSPDGPRIRCQERSTGRPCNSSATHVADGSPFAPSLVCGDCAKFYASHRKLERDSDVELIVQNMVAQAEDALLMTADDRSV